MTDILHRKYVDRDEYRRLVDGGYGRRVAAEMAAREKLSVFGWFVVVTTAAWVVFGGVAVVLATTGGVQ